MHIAASSPKSLNKDDLDQNLIENEKSILKEQLKDSGKSDDIISKMIDGKLNKFFEENVLLNQKFVMDPSISINSYLENSSKDSGLEIKIDKFIRYELGE
jgi:elongation factor Ts